MPMHADFRTYYYPSTLASLQKVPVDEYVYRETELLNQLKNLAPNEIRNTWIHVAWSNRSTNSTKKVYRGCHQTIATLTIVGTMKASEVATKYYKEQL